MCALVDVTSAPPEFGSDGVSRPMRHWCRDDSHLSFTAESFDQEHTLLISAVVVFHVVQIKISDICTCKWEKRQAQVTIDWSDQVLNQCCQYSCGRYRLWQVCISFGIETGEDFMYL